MLEPLRNATSTLEILRKEKSCVYEDDVQKKMKLELDP